MLAVMLAVMLILYKQSALKLLAPLIRVNIIYMSLLLERKKNSTETSSKQIFRRYFHFIFLYTNMWWVQTSFN